MRTGHAEATTVGVEEEIAGLLEAIEPEIRGAPLNEVFRNEAHSNEVFELRFDDGRTLIVKRGRHAWAAAHFEAARAASTLLRTRLGILAPRPLPLPPWLQERTDDRPVQAYWRIDLPTLAELWPELPADSRTLALRSWGVLLRRVHQLRPSGWGPSSASRETARSLAAFLEQDLAQRLLPAVTAFWPEGCDSLHALIDLIPAVARSAGNEPAVLVHGDLHMGNVLCRRAGGRVECVGLLDLDNAHAAPPESDLASFEVLHGPLFEQQLEPRHIRSLGEGYGAARDPWILAFFRAAHLANQAFSSALVGHAEHAHLVGEALRTELSGLRAGRLAVH